MERVLAEARNRPRLSKVSPEALSAIWSAFCSTLAATLQTGKGMECPFGTFSFHLGTAILVKFWLMQSSIMVQSSIMSTLQSSRAEKPHNGASVDYVDLGNQKKTQRTAVFELSERFSYSAPNLFMFLFRPDQA